MFWLEIKSAGAPAFRHQLHEVPFVRVQYDAVSLPDPEAPIQMKGTAFPFRQQVLTSVVHFLLRAL